MMDSSALVAITGNVPTTQFNRGPFQETYRHHQADFPSVVRPYVKRSFQVPRPEMLPLALRQAFKTAATGRPGPVNVDVPLDVFVEETDRPTAGARRYGGTRSTAAPARRRRSRAGHSTCSRGAERPVILVGNGADAVRGGAGRSAGSPRRSACRSRTRRRGPASCPADHPLALGVVGRNGTYPANQATRQADVLLALGARFDDRVSSGWIPGYTFTIPPTKLVQVDIDPEEIGRNYPVHLGVTADVKTFVQAVLALAEARGGAGGHDAVARGGRRVAAELGRVQRAPLPARRRPGAAGARRPHPAEGRAAGRHHRRGRRRASQLGRPAVAGLSAADAPPILGLRRHGLRRGRRPRREARRAGPVRASPCAATAGFS